MQGEAKSFCGKQAKDLKNLLPLNTHQTPSIITIEESGYYLELYTEFFMQRGLIRKAAEMMAQGFINIINHTAKKFGQDGADAVFFSLGEEEN